MQKVSGLTLFMMLIGLFFSCKQESSNDSMITAESAGYTYEYAENDPMNTRVYTLKNGLKVYLSAYADAPRAQVYIPVKAGGKNDPADNTGLAHYLEHMMFKGNDVFGTIDYEKEKVLLDSIESLFNQYADIDDSVKRKEHYRLIDQVSGEAAKFAIPNEYDKLMSTIGGKYLNAYTTDDRTVYMVDIPTNEIGRFLEIEGSRFSKIVNRLFHTELEAVYEEKNRGLDSDGRKVYENLKKLAFENHPYGTQTVIGTIEHLKNPSITEIEKYFYTYYRPNNMAVCISGDIDYDETIKMVDEYFGALTPNNDLKPMAKIVENPIAEPRTAQVIGPDAENLNLAFRFDGTGSDESRMVRLVDMLLNNSQAGLIDLNLVQKQKVLSAGSYVNDMNHYSLHTFYGTPKEGQSLEEVKDLILEEIEKIKTGDFEDWLIGAIVADFKKSEMSNLENNRARANKMVMAFTNDIPWNDYISEIDKMEKITKQQVIDFVTKNYSNNYVLVYKRTGEDPNKIKVEKPEITKVQLNREDKSAFHQRLAEKETPRLSPVFVDYQKDIVRGKTNSGIPILSKQNTENELFELYYLLDIGSNNDPAMKMAVEYLEFLGTPEMTNEQLKQELYKLGCSMGVFAADDKTYVYLSGLDENMEKAMAIFEELLENPQPDNEALESLIDRQLKSREDNKKNKYRVFNAVATYAEYGPESSLTNVLSNAEMQALNSADLVEKIKKMTDMEHRVLYYGPRDMKGLQTALNNGHKVPEKLLPLPQQVKFEQKSTEDPNVYWTHYDMVQTEFSLISRGEKMNLSMIPNIRLFNEYFGGGMNSIVFQEIRESQGLAYSTYANYSTPSKADENHSLMAYVGTQADKQSEAMAAIKGLLDDMPESEVAFDIAKKAILNKIESERITKSSVLWNYESARNRELDYDIRKDVYEQVQKMTIADLRKFHQEYIKAKSYNVALIGNREKIDFMDLQNYGKVSELTLEEIFGYEKVERIDPEMGESSQ